MSTTTRIERIVCPKCKRAQDAKIVFEDWMPFPCYAHDCTGCGYIILESEWEQVKEEA